MGRKSIVEKVNTFSHDYNCSELLAKAILKLCREAALRGYEIGLSDGGKLDSASLSDAKYMKGLKKRTLDLIMHGHKTGGKNNG